MFHIYVVGAKNIDLIPEVEVADLGSSRSLSKIRNESEWDWVHL